MAQRERIGLALFGAGRIGTVHFKDMLLNAGRVDVRWVVEEEVQKARTLLASYSLDDKIGVASIGEVDKVYSDPSVDAVVVCTPSFTHEKIVKQSLAAGKAVFCEKPLAPTIDATRECYDLAAEKNKPLFCAFNRRYDPQCRRVFNQIRSGQLGQPRMIKTTSRDTPAMMFKEYLISSGGIFLDSAVHDIDLVCWLAGEDPMSVYVTGHATGQMYKDCGDIDSCLVTLRFPGGAIGSIEVSRDAHCGSENRVEVLCTEGMIQSANRRPLDVWQWSLDGATVDPLYVQGIDRFLDSYRLELVHFLDAIDGKCALEVKASETLMVNRIAIACKESLDSGKVIGL